MAFNCARRCARASGRSDGQGRDKSDVKKSSPVTRVTGGVSAWRCGSAAAIIHSPYMASPTSKGIFALNRFSITRVSKGLLLCALGASYTAVGSESAPSANPIVVELRRGHCDEASKLINPDVKSNDRESAFIAGRLLDEGVCVRSDPEAAAHFFAKAAELGDRNGALDFAAKVGLGQGVEQDYQRAGDLCRAAGVDPKSRMSSYSLGYACTVRGVAGKLLRETLPTASFRPMAGAVALVEFTPSTGQLHIRATPHVASGEAHTGSLVGHPLINADKEIGKAWRDAVAAAPPPDKTRLDNAAVELPVDVDMTFELERKAAPPEELAKPLFQGDIHATTAHPN